MKCGIRFKLYFIASPEEYLSFYESDDTYQKVAKDVINMPHEKQYKSSVNCILHFMSQMTLEFGTIFTVQIAGNLLAAINLG
jgi:hypothetical protein